jgi:hypothetical protein
LQLQKRTGLGLIKTVVGYGGPEIGSWERWVSPASFAVTRRRSQVGFA